MSRNLEDFRLDSPRLETPEPDSRQGRRNIVEDGVQLLDDEGAISEQFEICLKHIFARYCTPPPPRPSPSSAGQISLLAPPEGAYLTTDGLDAWAKDTNGQPFDDATKEELLEFMDVTDDGGLTLKGFMQIYQLQTENDEEETWKDLSKHGFDRSLKLVTTRREATDAEQQYAAWVDSTERHHEDGPVSSGVRSTNPTTGSS
ncbi:hypothetical protein CERSUDRAFT_113578 [Gelatoporia subvermispora B]|uniref:EF-hand domain-containing protein n=1 Tax=Ceriporiopsis subvermispora (strain B) TaxID=914234 RepID=M2RI22_CERS8|nr:hypothetical protein CERSUDRAFT_113578 [Gelatoporia subvermispora B]